jgi:rubrerythrin
MDNEVQAGKLTRAEALLRGALAVGGLYGIGAIGPYVQQALATSHSDVDILNFLLTFEYLQWNLYERGHSEINDKGEKMPLKSKERSLLAALSSEESEHVAAVKKMIEKLGGKPVEEGKYAYAFREYDVFLRLAGMIENAAVGAYNGAIPSLKSAEAMALASSIVQVEGRHAATVLVHYKEEPAPEPFDVGTTEYSALVSIEQFTGIQPEYEESESE